MDKIIIFILALTCVSWSQIIEIFDQKDLRKFLRTHTNVLIFYQKTSRSGKDWLPILTEAADEIEGKGSVVSIDCKASKKLCKRMKVDPSPIALKHYRDGKFHKDYDRIKSSRSITRFLEDPTNDMPWDEDQTAHSVVHVEREKDLMRLVMKEPKPILIMFYVPWCGYCKRLKPEFAKAATDLKQEAVLAGMDVDKPELMGIRRTFNITGFPTLFYIREGRVRYKYGGENTKDGIVTWMRNPQPPKQPEEDKKWSEEPGAEDVNFLTADTFDAFLKQEPSVLVMFYAPWCGHCKAMKPSFNEVANKMKKEGIKGALAAVDATKDSSLAERFKVKGFPTVKYFRDGEYAFDFNERTTDKLLEFMQDPKEPPPPPPPEKPWSEQKSEVQHLSSDNYIQFLKKKKHVLVMFYAPWCGHCKKAKPEFARAAEILKDDRKVSFAAVDCTEHSAVCTNEVVDGFPTFHYYNFGKKSEKGYTLGREEEDFVAFMRNPENPRPGQKRHWKGVSGMEDITFLNAENFDEETKGKEAFVKFYAPWCGHCKKMKPAFAELAGIVRNTLPKVLVGAVDATEDEGLASNFGVKGYPSLLYIKADGSHEKYRGARTVEDMLTYIQSKHLKNEVKETIGEKKEPEIPKVEEKLNEQEKPKLKVEEQPKPKQEKPKLKEQEKLKPKEQEKLKPKEQEKPKQKEQETLKPKEQEKPKFKEQEKPKPKEQEKPKPKEQEKPKPKEQETLKPKEQDKPKLKEQEKPKPKPKEQEKPKLKEQEKPKPKVEEKPKPKEQEKPKPKPKEQEKPKPKEQEKLKPKEQEKPKPKEQEKPKPKPKQEKPKPKPKEQEKPKPKEQEKPKPKEQEKPKPKEQEKPKPKEQEKPKPKPKVEEKPKPKEQEKPKPKPKQEKPKPTPKEQEKPKPKEQEKPKPKEQEKPKPKGQEKPKQKEQEKPKPKEQEKPKPTEQKKPKPKVEEKPKPKEQVKPKPKQEKPKPKEQEKPKSKQEKPKPKESKTHGSDKKEKQEL